MEGLGCFVLTCGKYYRFASHVNVVSLSGSQGHVANIWPCPPCGHRGCKSSRETTPMGILAQHRHQRATAVSGSQLSWSKVAALLHACKNSERNLNTCWKQRPLLPKACLVPYGRGARDIIPPFTAGFRGPSLPHPHCLMDLNSLLS